VALRRVDGVEDAQVSYPSGAASVVYDVSVTSPEEFIGELTRMTGFRATITGVVTGSDGISGKHAADEHDDDRHGGGEHDAEPDMDEEHEHDHDGERGGHDTP
jgi:copper chaperone CopZ